MNPWGQLGRNRRRRARWATPAVVLLASLLAIVAVPGGDGPAASGAGVSVLAPPAVAAIGSRVPPAPPNPITAPPPLIAPGPLPGRARIDTASRAAAKELIAPVGPLAPERVSGLWQAGTRPSWWQSALILQTLIDYLEHSGDRDPAFTRAVDRLYTANVMRQVTAGNRWFANRFNDDTAWWGLAWLRAAHYELSRGDRARAGRFLTAARADAEHIWLSSRACAGGMRWRTGLPPDTITQSAFVALAAELASFSQTELSEPSLAAHWRGEALSALDWLRRSGLIDRRAGLVHDRLDSRCHPSGGPVNYTLAETARAFTDAGVASGRASLLDDARRFLGRIVTPSSGMISGGILQQACEARAGMCGNRRDPFNLPAYKGLVVNALAGWARAAHSALFDHVLRTQAAAVLVAAAAGGCRPNHCIFGFYWGRRVPAARASVPPGPSTQASSLEALTAAPSMPPSPPRRSGGSVP